MERLITGLLLVLCGYILGFRNANHRFVKRLTISSVKYLTLDELFAFQTLLCKIANGLTSKNGNINFNKED